VTLHRFFVSPEVLSSPEIALRGEVTQQISRVLRLREGEEIVLLDGTGQEHRVKLRAVVDREVRGVISHSRMAPGEPALKLTLYQALLRREKFEQVLQKGTEVGISEFVPVQTARSLPKADTTREGKLERWRRIIREAAEQSERAVVPSLHEPLLFGEALQRASRQEAWLFAWEREASRGPTSALRTLPQMGSAALFVGPEGGFEDEEVEAAEAAGATTFGLGPRVLRAETVAPVLAGLALFASGDLDRSYGG
jgi:16S rRNA (uracil1498-N3)-methyltransferase